MGYGLSESSWYSDLKNFDLYDGHGVVVRSGDLKVKARSSSSLFHFDVSFPFSKIRLGMGISFVQVYIDKIAVAVDDGDPSNVFLNEAFVFDKLYAVVEVPLKVKTTRPILLSLKSNAGYFTYAGVNSPDFFGEDSRARTAFVNIGLMCSLGIYPRLFLFACPGFEYMQLNNTGFSGGHITHRIVSGGITGGLRIGLSGNN